MPIRVTSQLESKGAATARLCLQTYMSVASDFLHDFKSWWNRTRFGTNDVLLQLLRSEQIPDALKEDYILTGYRPPGLSFRGCLRSVFAWHNETTNIWSHMILTFVYVLLVGYLQATGSVDFLRDGYALPFLVCFFGHTLCTSISTVAHCFMCMSVDVKCVCFYCDYVGVTSLGVMAAVPYYYYSRPVGFDCYEHPFTYFVATIVACSVGCYLTCATLLQKTDIAQQLRLAAFAVPYFICTTPLLQRMVYATHWEPACSLHLWHIGFVLFGAFIYGAKIPERFVPHVFDCSLHSHCLMHTFTGTGSFIHIYANFVDMRTRRYLLLHENDPTVLEVFWPVGVLLTIQVSIVGHFCYKLVKLHCDNKNQRTSK